MAEPITKELREYVEENRMGNGMGVETMWGNSVPYDLLQIADCIDAEHERRMADCRRETKRDVVRYVRGVLTDYDRGVRRVRKGDKAEVVRCRDCKHAAEHSIWANTTICDLFTGHEVTADDYCSRGDRREEGDDGR